MNLYYLLFLFIVFYFIIKKNELFTNINYADYKIICARYNKDVDFLNETNMEYNVIQKCIDNNCDTSTCPNIGNEASSYLFYIINNWESLPKHLIFIHDENSSWHHDGKITDNITKWIQEYENNGSTYYEFNSVSVNPEHIQNGHPNTEPGFQKFYTENLEQYLGKWTDLPLKPRKCCAQFIVSREQIKKNPLEMYKKLYHWILNDNDDTLDGTRGKSYTKGLYCEFIWNFIFTKN
jgi:hypothetical protein